MSGLAVFSGKNAYAMFSSNGITQQFQGFDSSDDVIKWERLYDSASHETGMDDQTMISIDPRSCGTFTLKLLGTSPMNAFLTKHEATYRLGAAGFNPLQLQVGDSVRGDVINGYGGYVKKVPDITFGTTKRVRASGSS